MIMGGSFKQIPWAITTIDHAIARKVVERSLVLLSVNVGVASAKPLRCVARHMTVASSRYLKGLAVVVLVAAVSWHAWWASRGWHIPGLSGHEFRQAQTAVSIRAMKEDGFRLDYSTPIIGKPWAIPFEFPLYQGLAHLVSQKTGLGVVESGRWVSLLAFYLALPALILLMRRAGFSPFAAILGTLPVLFAPVYIFYSRTVLIESTALCASAWFLCLLMSYRAKRTAWLLAATLLMGVAAVLTKATTWAVFCLPWAICVVVDLWRARRNGWRACRRCRFDRRPAPRRGIWMGLDDRPDQRTESDRKLSHVR
jgi:hypothetical protein